MNPERNWRPFWMAVAGVTLLVAGGSVFAQSKITDVSNQGSYEVFLTTDADKHEGAEIIVMRTEEGTNNQLTTYGLAFVSNKGAMNKPPQGDGMVCNDAVLMLGDSALSCTRVKRNPAGKIIFEETLTVGVTGALYCNALKTSLIGEGLDDKIVDTSDSNCDDPDERCICYQITHRNPNQPEVPPSPGAGSGRGD